MKRLVCIGEGHGEVNALPRLCHAIREYLRVTDWSVDPQGIRLRRSEFVAPSLGPQRGSTCNARGISRAVELARRRPAQSVLVVCDADDDCAASWAASVGAMEVSGLGVGAVMAVREYEGWLLWNIDDAVLQANGIPDPESKRDAKGALRRIVRGYSPTTHQLELTRQLDVSRVRDRSRSFDKLVRTLATLFGVAADPRSTATKTTARKRRR